MRRTGTISKTFIDWNMITIWVDYYAKYYKRATTELLIYKE